MSGNGSEQGRLRRRGAGLLLLGMIMPASAQDLPLWEAGVGVGGIHLPLYRGAADERAYLLPYPYLVYRGERLRIDDNQVRGRLLRSDAVQLDLSLAGGVPVPNNGDGARAGMPSLDPTAEIGPALKLQLAPAIWLELPLRAAFSIGGGSMRHQGWIAAPSLNYRGLRLNHGLWKLNASIGPIFADQAYHAYFYEVPGRYATANRSVYPADGGYGGLRISLNLQRQFEHVWLGAFARWDSLHEATFNDSPLVERDSYHIVGLAATWVLSRSSRTTTAP